MIVTFMFHRVSYPDDPMWQKKTIAFIQQLAKRYRMVKPGDPVKKTEIAVCLSFDDAHFDFYHVIFPLLKQLNIPAVLAVPVAYIADTVEISPAQRLAIDTPEAMARQQPQAFCSWQELKAMQQSGLVEIAAHGFWHKNLKGLDEDGLQKEVVVAKKIIMEKLNIAPSSFIYAYGAFDAVAKQLVDQHYAFDFRIGAAVNDSWRQRVLYRLDANVWLRADKPFKSWQVLLPWLKMLSNRLRKK